jgi:hypothetical protein
MESIEGIEGSEHLVLLLLLLMMMLMMIMAGLLDVLQDVQRPPPATPLQALREGYLRVVWQKKVGSRTLWPLWRPFHFPCWPVLLLRGTSGRAMQIGGLGWRVLGSWVSKIADGPLPRAMHAVGGNDGCHIRKRVGPALHTSSSLLRCFQIKRSANYWQCWRPWFKGHDHGGGDDNDKCHERCMTLLLTLSLSLFLFLSFLSFLWLVVMMGMMIIMCN